MRMKKHFIGAMFTESEIEAARIILQEHRFNAQLREKIVLPALPRINAAMEEEYNADYLLAWLKHMARRSDK